MVGSCHHVYEVPVVTMALMLAECFMNAGIDKLAVVFFLAERQDEVPVALEVSVFFEVDQFIGLHDGFDSIISLDL